MRVSQLFGLPLREAPADTDFLSHQFLLRAGYVRQLAAGVFSYLPLAQRSMRKIEQILREEMDAIGGQEVCMPVVHPAEVWQKSGRWDEIDETMARFVDRRGRDMLLAMTHEEVVGELCISEINSYRQLPLLVYQLQTKFRDELRARGGLIRVREFTMKDSYSLDLDADGLHEQYVRHYHSYFRIGARSGLPLVAVASDVGMMGGKAAHEFMYVTPIGEDDLVLCESCGYAANREVASFVKPPPEVADAEPLEKVHTPATKTIADLAEFLDRPASQMAKAVFLVAIHGSDKDDELVLAMVRGDMDVNPVAVRNALSANDVRPAQDEEIRKSGAVAGFASPIGVDRSRVTVLVDDLVAESTNLVTGANEVDHHFVGSNYGRDYEADHVVPIAGAYEGAGCAQCGGTVSLARGVEVGNIFKLGTRYSAAMDATYTAEDGSEQPIVMGSYGIGVGRMLGCIAEEHNDENGLALPISVAPFHVNMVSLARKEPTVEAAESLYRELLAAGVEVLFDDRKASAGVKMAEADLRGIPLRLVVSERSVKNGGAELKHRTASEGRIVPLDEVVATVRGEIDAAFAALAEAADGMPTWPEGEEA
ncbi:MAG: proline--tRNA ligase [Acidobacteriota bacterium]